MDVSKPGHAEPIDGDVNVIVGEEPTPPWVGVPCTYAWLVAPCLLLQLITRWPKDMGWRIQTVGERMCVSLVRSALLLWMYWEASDDTNLAMESHGAVLMEMCRGLRLDGDMIDRGVRRGTVLSRVVSGSTGRGGTTEINGSALNDENNDDRHP